jgi:hypothetical protein
MSFIIKDKCNFALLFIGNIVLILNEKNASSALHSFCIKCISNCNIRKAVQPICLQTEHYLFRHFITPSEKLHYKEKETAGECDLLPIERESFSEDPIWFVLLVSPTPVLTMEHIYLDLIPGGARASIFRSSQKGQEGLGEGEGKNTLGMSYWFLLPFFTQLKLIHSRTYEFGRLCRQRGKLLI